MRQASRIFRFGRHASGLSRRFDRINRTRSESSVVIIDRGWPTGDRRIVRDFDTSVFLEDAVRAGKLR